MRTDLDFETKSTKELLSDLDFEYFLKENIEKQKYSSENIETIYSAYKMKKMHLKVEYRKNKKQFNYYLEGQVRKMFTGGFLPALFHLDKGRSHTLVDFEAVGESWAYFNLWVIHYKRKIRKEKAWDTIIKIGSILAIILSILKVLEALGLIRFKTK